MSEIDKETEPLVAPEADMDISRSNPPSKALIQLLSPDGYYTYLGIPKKPPTADGDEGPDEDVVKKNYRKLSLKHHPDKPGGSADTFRVLNRAQKVLLDPKLRQQYDMLGIDLHEEEDQDDREDDEDNDRPPSRGIVNEIAGMVLTYILQAAVRTALMGATSVLVVRYIWLVIPMLLFLGFVAYRIHLVADSSTALLSPFAIAVGIVIMYLARGTWYLFFFGEALVIGMFLLNSIGTILPNHPGLLMGGVAVAASLAALWFRGKFWNYVIVLALELFLAIFVAIAFPIMDMISEAVMNEKLKKVGERVRTHHQQMEQFYAAQHKLKS